MPYFSLAIAIIAGALGNIFIKLGSKGIPSTPLAMLTSPLVLIGIVLLVGSFPFYSMVLQKLPLSVGFPLVTSSSFLLVVVISYFFLKEPLTLINLFGILLLIAGLFLVGYK